MKQALKPGKPGEQFRSDSDFKDYWNDPDFNNVLIEKLE